MKQVLDFLTENRTFYLATCDGAQPRVRPMGFVMGYEGKLAFCTSNQKEMYRQMKANPAIEICCVDAEMKTLRLSGRAVFCTSPDSQQKALEAQPFLRNMYDVGDGKFEIFTLEDAKASCLSMDGERQELLV